MTMKITIEEAKQIINERLENLENVRIKLLQEKENIIRMVVAVGIVSSVVMKGLGVWNRWHIVHSVFIAILVDGVN